MGVETFGSIFEVDQPTDELQQLMFFISSFQKLFGHQMANFQITIDSMWQNNGSFEVISSDKPDALGGSKAVKIRRKSPSPVNCLLQIP